MAVQFLDEIRKQFRHEWLLIALENPDDLDPAALRGTLLGHSPSRDEIYRSARRHQGRLMTVYSDDWPEDLAAAF